MNDACRDLAGLQSMRTRLNAISNQIDAAGKKPMTAAKLQAHRQRMDDHNREVRKNEKKIVAQSTTIDLLLPQGALCRQRGKKLASRGTKLDATRNELAKKAAKLAGKLYQHKRKVDGLLNQADPVSHSAASLSGELEQATGQAVVRLAELRRAREKAQKQIDALSKASEDARKAYEELRALQGKTEKSIERVKNSVRIGNP
jgi:hypothetical protein